MPTTWVMTCAYAPSGSFITCGGLDNKITLYKITSDEDMSKQKRVIANHTNYISCNKFMYSDQQVKYKYKKINKLFFNNVFFYKSCLQEAVIARVNYGMLKLDN
jgi:hypothetical protein